jgi:hypothetical protein
MLRMVIKLSLNPSSKIEDIMTRRSMLTCVDQGEVELAPAIAGENDLDAVRRGTPLRLKGGSIGKPRMRSMRSALKSTYGLAVCHTFPTPSPLVSPGFWSLLKRYKGLPL